MNLAITGNDVFGRPVTVAVSGGRIESVRPADPASAPADLWVLPGLIDIQVNGFGGYDLNAADATPDAVAGVTRALWRHGVTRFCPTICTASHEQMAAALRAVAQACDEMDWVGRAVAGVHVEGPYISPEDGPRGAHPADYVRAPDWREVEAFQAAAGGRLRVFTLAPERPGALELIERLSRGMRRCRGIPTTFGRSWRKTASRRASSPTVITCRPRSSRSLCGPKAPAAAC